MDVRLPDGTVIRNVPDGTTKADLVAKLQRNGYDTSWHKQDAQPRSTGQEVGRQLGLTGRYVVEAATALPGMLAKIPQTILNAGLAGADYVSGGNVPYRFPDQNQLVSDTLTSAGVPEPETQQERLVGDASRALAGAGSIAGTTRNASNALVRKLSERTGLQAASAITGGTAAGATREAGGGPLAQFVAGMVGGFAPSVAVDGLPAFTRFAFRGSEDNIPQMQENIRTFEAAGDRPSVGQATQNRRTQGAESLLSRTPGGAGVMAARGEQQAQNIGSQLDATAARLSPKSGGEQAGRAIERGIRGEGGFVDQFKAQQSKLYDEIDKFVPQDAPVNVTNTKQALAALNADIKDAPRLSQWFKNQRIEGIENALKADTKLPPKSSVQFADGVTKIVETPTPPRDWMPYESIKKLRTLVGNEMADAGLASDVPRSKWKALYAALSRDLETAASQSPEGKQAWQRANNYTRAGMSRIEAMESVIDKAGGPERVFQAAISGTREGATTLRSVMQSLPNEGQRTITATVLRRLGRANPSAQDDVGGAFSTETFLTNWNKLSPEAKRVLFDRFGPQFRGDMDTVAKVAANLRGGSQVFRNPSGTAQATTQAATAGAFLFSVVSGNVGSAAAIGGGVGASNLSARLLTNPRFVKWLATNSRRPTGAVPAAITQLAQMGQSDPDLAEAAQAYQAALGQQQP